MDISIIAHVLRERIMCYDKISTTATPTIIHSVDDIKDKFKEAQTFNTQIEEIVYYLKADGTNPNFKWAVYLVLMGCVANIPICVVLDGEDMGVPPFTLRSMLRLLCEGCSTLTTSQIVSILERLAYQVNH
jgi:hypothetical protein